MPELPDILNYVEAMGERLTGARILALSIHSPFLLRTVTPSPQEAIGQDVVAVDRIGKRVMLVTNHDLALVFHLMIAGRFHWTDGDDARSGRHVLCSITTTHGKLTLTENASKKRASLHVYPSRQVAHDTDRGGLNPLQCGREAFGRRLRRENRTLKRALTDPRIFDGIGNAYSDEILHAAKLSPMKRTVDLSNQQSEALFAATRGVLIEWIERLRLERGGSFPTRVTAFRPEMAVHGRFGKACPECSATVQRIRYTEREVNYCPQCQTHGKLLADHALSRLLKGDWPKRWDELER